MVKYSSKSQAIKELIEMSITNDVKNPADIIELAKPLVDKKFSSLSDFEKYEALEQLIVAYLDMGDIEEAEKYFALLTKKIKKESSYRVQKIAGMIEEAKENYDGAITIYNKILEKDETNQSVHKRLIAVNISMGKNEEAIKLLNKYLETFVTSDEDAYLQLADLYLTENMYQQAAHCMEDLILFSPSNHLYYLRYADILCCLNRYQIASKYYCEALDLCNDNTRALYGILYTNKHLLNSKDDEKLTSNETIKALIDLAKEELLKIYKKSPNYSILKEYIENQ